MHNKHIYYTSNTYSNCIVLTSEERLVNYLLYLDLRFQAIAFSQPQIFLIGERKDQVCHIDTNRLRCGKSHLCHVLPLASAPM